jgi:hypothetical protein
MEYRESTEPGDQEYDEQNGPDTHYYFPPYLDYYC